MGSPFRDDGNVPNNKTNNNNWQFGDITMKNEPPDSDSGIMSSPGSVSHEQSYPEETHDHLRRLEMSLLEKRLYSIDENSSAESDELSRGNGAAKAKAKNAKGSSANNVKMHKCKQCDFFAYSKVEYWEHIKVHITADKQLTCKLCPFVTQYKHHMEFHKKNHEGDKPFKCDKCDYQCVNNSMLISHLRSHSNIYPYRCKDCSYVSKYCHSLKTHLRNHKHDPDVVLDEHGNPCPHIIIDVYGTRRGPKLKTVAQTKQRNVEPAPPPPQPQLPPTPPDVFPFGLNLMAAATQFPYPFFANPQLMHNFQQLMMGPQHQQQQLQHEIQEQDQVEASTSALDLSKPAQNKSRRRKGPAFKLASLETSQSEEEPEQITADVEPMLLHDEEFQEPEKEAKAVTYTANCQYCNIGFGDPVMYTIHMGQHGFNSPFTCNMCGVECNDQLDFFMHIARHPHL